MSLILEALRKSEAERRRAQVPDLLTEPQVLAPRAMPAPQRWPWFAGGVVLLAMAVWFATTRNSEPLPETIVIPAEAKIQTDDATVPTPRVPGDDDPAPTARPAPELRRPLVVAPPVIAPVVRPAIDDTTTNERATATVPVSRPAPAQRAPMAALRAPPSADFERLSDLRGEEREQLPPLKLSMHMWNDAAARRFVIIDGARLGVGDRIGAVIVTDIVPDGVVLDWNGRALKLPLR